MPPKSTASKSRRKECAKKRKHDVGSSSRVVEGESDLLIPGSRSLRHLSGAQIARVEELRAKGASGSYYFDLPMLDAYGCREEVERMMTRRSWEHLFSWRDDTYEPVVHEFIATYTAIPSNHMWTPCMKFTLFGREHQVSLIQLGEYLGFYTPEDARTEEWRNLPTDFDSNAAEEEYWHQITNGQGGRFTGTKPNTSKVVRPPLLMMKLLLNLTFGGRNKNLHKIYRFDLFNLWSLEMNEPIQMACTVQHLFTSQTQPKCPTETRKGHGDGGETPPPPSLFLPTATTTSSSDQGASNRANGYGDRMAGGSSMLASLLGSGVYSSDGSLEVSGEVTAAELLGGMPLSVATQGSS
nr:uncharacterized protein LOC110642325 isoform X1 [Ipomoea batatas]